MNIKLMVMSFGRVWNYLFQFGEFLILFGGGSPGPIEKIVPLRVDIS